MLIIFVSVRKGFLLRLLGNDVFKKRKNYNHHSKNLKKKKKKYGKENRYGYK